MQVRQSVNLGASFEKLKESLAFAKNEVVINKLLTPSGVQSSPLIIQALNRLTNAIQTHLDECTVPLSEQAANVDDLKDLGLFNKPGGMQP